MTKFTAESVQFSWFLADTSGLVAGDLMNKLLDLEPDLTQSNRTPNPQMPFLSSATRVENDFKFILNVSPGRTDLIVKSATEPDEQPFKQIDVQKAFEIVIRYLERKGSVGLQNIYRFAVVCAFLDEVESHEKANKAFFEKVGLRYMAGAMDQSFIVNVRKNFDGIEPEVNRLVRYSIDHFQQIEMINVGPKSINLNNGSVVSEAFLLKTVIDVNSVPRSEYIIDGSELLSMAKAFSEEIMYVHKINTIGDMA
jgi:hypothetical protein